MDKEKLAKARQDIKKAVVKPKPSSEYQEVMDLPDSPVNKRRQDEPKMQDYRSNDEMIKEIKLKQERVR